MRYPLTRFLLVALVVVASVTAVLADEIILSF